MDAAELTTALEALPSWRLEGDRIHRQFSFPDFAHAFHWMTQVAEVAERLNHHPEWKNVYSRVEVTLTTHDAGRLTRLDFELARAMDTLAEALTPR
ncbi:MAG: 4a-hydroxytetrahydrobiopterin dehydratase [Polyangiaceae bacterium]|nr:4a-hydroxytetrahydrobiopterin dehydratase [Polyangiaceae bacterium]MCW5791988.1 4a-hydroxytetrahydrobiopterin dehydratase [Polyangiaceae bacterium]